MDSLTYKDFPFLKELGIQEDNPAAYYAGAWRASGQAVFAVNPNTGKKIARCTYASKQDYESALKVMVKARNQWVSTTMPFRGEVIRELGNAFRKYKQPLGKLISLQMGKILSEGLGQVQEAIDICDYACGLSRTIGGKIFPSERPDHFLMENWIPYGLFGCITAFNFPCAVFIWNFAISLVCGNLTVWKGSIFSNLVTIAVSKIILQVLHKHQVPEGVFVLLQGDREIGQLISADKRIPLISFTGSTHVGRIIAGTVAQRFGKAILQLGGNNATIIMDDADLQLAFKGSVFAAAGTCGQRCTTLRRLIIHQKVFDQVVNRLVKAYKTITIGDPMDEKTLCGPLNNPNAIQIYKKGLEKAISLGSTVLVGGKALQRQGYFVEPTIIHTPKDSAILQEELFCPILHVIKFSTLEQAIQINNSVSQGLSSSLFTKNVQNIFRWIHPLGSDCGIVNVNIGPSGAQIGGAFGGQKQTGGGRASGSDSWKQHMKRQTCTINYGTKLPLAQGVKFQVGQ